MILVLVSLLLGNVPSFAFSESSDLKINCLIINLEYVDCIWSEDEHKHNYTFKARFSDKEILECPKYHKISGVNVGCMFPYEITQRFNNFQTWLYFQNSSLATQQEESLKEYVKLNPPVNLSVVEKKDAELWLYWNYTKMPYCTESEVRYKTENNEWKSTTPATRESFSLPFPSKKRYTFQVRARISNSCGQSKFWSEWSDPVFWGSESSDLKINCLIINLEYVDCIWSEDEHKHNYTFKARFSDKEILECPKYHKINGVNVGCMFPYEITQRFNNFQTWLYFQNSSLATQQEESLKEYVKLNPPVNLSVVEKKDAELWLYWNYTKISHCIESEVRYRTENNESGTTEWKSTTPATRESFSLPFPSKKRYTFQVRARISDSCGQSKFWSEWSDPVFWGSVRAKNIIQDV